MKTKNFKLIEFIEHAKIVHGNKYNYSKIKYKNSTSNVPIVCPKHGIFMQTPSSHLRGGCPYCSYKRLTIDEFMAHVTKLYGDKYDYSKSNYSHKIAVTENLTINCKIHGDFKVRIDKHLKGHGCLKCKWEENKTMGLKKILHEIPEKDEQVVGLDSSNQFFVKVQFTTENSHKKSYVWTDPFNSRVEAEKYLEDIKISFELTYSTVIEALIVELKQPLLDSNTVIKIIKCFKIGSYEAYLNWWDVANPLFIPRNLQEYYPDFYRMFNMNELGLVTTIIKPSEVHDYDVKQNA